jgi:hypothetical protein
MTMKPATVVKFYASPDGFPLIDVRFDHRPDTISHGHFAWAIQELVEDIDTITFEQLTDS